MEFKQQLEIALAVYTDALQVVENRSNAKDIKAYCIQKDIEYGLCSFFIQRRFNKTELELLLSKLYLNKYFMWICRTPAMEDYKKEETLRAITKRISALKKMITYLDPDPEPSI